MWWSPSRCAPLLAQPDTQLVHHAVGIGSGTALQSSTWLGEHRRAARTPSVLCVLPSQAASDVYAPLSGEVIEVNEVLSNEPATVSAPEHTTMQATRRALCSGLAPLGQVSPGPSRRLQGACSHRGRRDTIAGKCTGCACHCRSTRTPIRQAGSSSSSCPTRTRQASFWTPAPTRHTASRKQTGC